MIRHTSLALLLVCTGACSQISPLDEGFDGGGPSPGSTGPSGMTTGFGTTAGFTAGASSSGSTGPTTIGVPTWDGGVGFDGGGGSTSTTGSSGGGTTVWLTGGSTGGMTGTTGSTTTGGITGSFADGGAVTCNPNGVCCDSAGNCCLDVFGLCWADGGSPFPDGGVRDGGGVEITDGGWEPPDGLVVEEPTLPTAPTPAWRDSTEPLCTEQQGWVSSHALWSDERGVFVLVASDGYYGGGPFGPFPAPVDQNGPGLALWFNDGTGWEPYYDAEEERFFWSEHQLRGLPDGPLFAYGMGDDFNGRGCGLANIEEGSFDCQPVYEASAVSVVDEELAYAVADGALIRYQNGRWGPYPGVLNDASNLTALWADETSIFAGGYRAGQWLELVDGQWVVLDTGTLEHFQTMWGYSATDVYAGTEEGGLYHYDGTTVSEISWPHESCDYAYPMGIRGIWGAEGITYFHTANQLAKLENGSVEVIAEWPCEYTEDGYDPPSIRSIWGNGPDELFISVTDMREPRQQCGVTFVLFYDGEKLHRL